MAYNDEHLTDVSDAGNPRPEGSACSGLLGCMVCGGKMVFIRAKHPGGGRRQVCPTCLAETIEDIKERLQVGYNCLLSEKVT